MKQFTTLLFLALFFSFQGLAQWYWQYPIPQGNNLNDFHFVDDDGFAVGDRGAIIKSIDAGSTWELMDSITSFDLTSVFFDHNFGYAVGDIGTILRTDDAEVWTNMETGIHWRLNGVTITESNASFTVGYKGLILKSHFDLDTWTPVSSGTLKTLHDIDFASNENGIIVGDSGLILRTTNMGDTWTDISTGSDLFYYNVYFPSSSTGYIVGKKGVILKTTNAGESWSDVSSPLVENDLYGVHFYDDNNGYVSGNFGVVVYTRDGGLNWNFNQTHNSSSFNAVHQFEADTTIGRAMVCGNNGIILETDSVGKWSSITSGSSDALNSVVFPGDNIAFAVGGDLFDDEPFIIRKDETDKWMPMVVDTITHYLTDIYFLNSTTGYISGKKGSIYKTSDGGTSWVPLQTDVFKTLYGVYFLNSVLGLAVGHDGTIIKTISGDTTWTELNSGTTNNLYSITMSSTNNNGFVVGEHGTILKIYNGGSQIAPVTSGTNEPLYDVFLLSDNLGFIVGFNGTILKLITNAGGESITSIPSGVTTPLNEVFFTDDSTGYIAGEGGVILKTTNGGETWYPQYSGTSNNLRGLTFTDEETGYVVGSGLAVLKTTNAGGAVILPGIYDIEKPDIKLVLYPNPSTEYTFVEYDLQEKSDVLISILDLTGRKVTPDIQYHQFPGKQKIKIETREINTGIYIVVIMASNYSYTEKLVVY